MELRHLRSFIVVAEELHFSRAALRLGISQPPLSQQIRLLERELGVELFRRSASGVTLSDAGHVLRRSAQRILEDAEGMQQLATRIRAGHVGVLRVGFVGSALYGPLPGLIRATRARLPDVTVTLEEIETGDQIQALLNHHIDVGVLRPPVQAHGLSHRHVFEEPLVAVLPDDHPLASRPHIDVGDLRDDEFVLFPRQLGVGLWDLVVSSCKAAGFQPQIVREVEHIHTMVGLVASGVGVTLVPASVHRLRVPKAAYLPLEPATGNTVLSIAWNSDDDSPHLHRFLEVALDVRSESESD